jgi:hypothetical protein
VRLWKLLNTYLSLGCRSRRSIGVGCVVFVGTSSMSCRRGGLLDLPLWACESACSDCSRYGRVRHVGLSICYRYCLEDRGVTVGRSSRTDLTPPPYVSDVTSNQHGRDFTRVSVEPPSRLLSNWTDPMLTIFNANILPWSHCILTGLDR